MLLPLTFSLIAAFAQQPTAIESLRARLETARVEQHLPGMALAVVRDGALLYAEGFGLADMESARAADADTLFAIGSTTKAFTTSLIAMLAEEGNLGWDDPVVQHLPTFKLAPRGGEAGSVTIRDLVCHRTGFTRMGTLWAAGLVSSERLLEQATHAEAWDDFRARFHYNNVMYLAAGSAAAAAGGAPWATQVRLRILEPLGMRSTYVTEAEYREQARLAAGYDWDEDRGDWRRLPMRNVDRVAPAGAIVSSVHDMSRWLRFLLALGATDENRLISAAALRATWEPQIEVGGDLSYALGWFVQPWRGRTIIQHGGNIDGFAAQVAFIPEENLGYVLLCNLTATPLQSGSMDLVFGALLEPAADAALTEDLARFVGDYEADFAAFQNRTVEVRIEKGKLGVDVPEQMLYLLKPPDENGLRFFELTDTVSVEFETDASGRVCALRMNQAGQIFRLPRAGAPPESWEPSPVADAELTTGRYFFAPQKVDWMVRAENGVLRVEVPGQTEYELGDADAEGWRLFRAMPSVSVRFTPSEREPVQMDYREISGGKLTLLRRGPLAEERVSLTPAAEIRALYDAESRRKALQALGDLRLTGTVRMVHQGVEGSCEIRMAADGRMWQRVDFGEFGAVVEGLDPARALAWTSGDFGPYEEFVGKQLEDKLGADPRAQCADLFAAYGEPVTLRLEELDGEACAVLALPRAAGGRDLAWLTLTHGDVLKLETSISIPGAGSLPVTLHFGEFRDLGGLRFPHFISSENDASGRTETKLSAVETRLSFTDVDMTPPR